MDYYYAYGTNHGDGIEVWRSTNLVGWEYMGLALHKDNCTEKQWFWAPEVYHKNGKYYMYFSANEHLFVATGDSPTGPFYQQGGYQVQNILGSEKCIDSHVFFDDDGSAWLFFARFVPDERIYSCRLSSDLITPVAGTLRQCLAVTDAWEKIWPTVVEGPNVIKRNGIYYLTYSANSYESHDYAVGYATTTNIASGTWTKFSGNPILRRMEDLVGCGHHSLFYDKVGNLKIAYHAHNSTSNIHPRLLYFGDMYFEGNTLRFNYGIQSLRPLWATEALCYMTERWSLSDLRGNPTSKGYDARKIRNFCYKDGKLYCVYDNDNIKVISAENGEDLGNLKLGDVCKGGTRKFCDVKCYQGHIVACNLALPGDEFRVYTWDNDNAEPRLLMSTTDLHGCNRMGGCMEFAPSGNWNNDMWINFANDDGNTTRVVEFHWDGANWTDKVWEVTTDGTNQFKVGMTARAYPNLGLWWIDGSDGKPSHFYINGNNKLQRDREIGDVGNWGASHHEFTFRGLKYAVNLKFDGNLFGRARIMMDDAGDYGHTTWIGEYPWQGLSSTHANELGTGDVVVDTDGNNYVRIFVCSTGQGLTCYAQGNPPVYNPTYIGGFNLEEKWNCSENAGSLISKGYDAGKINNFCYANGKLYCVYDHSAIKTLDAQTGEDLGNLSLGGIVSGGTYALSDVKIADGKVVACNYAKAGETLKFYVWDDDMKDPYLLYSTNNLNGANAIGKCMEISGDASFDRDLWFAFGEDDGTKTTIYEYHRDINKNWEAKSTRVKYDANTELRTGDNCRVYPLGGPFWIDGNNCQPIHVTYNTDAGCLTKSLEIPTGDSWGGSHKAQFWGGVKYSLDIKFDNKKNARMRVITDNNGDYSNNTLIGEYPAAGLGSTVDSSGAGDVIVRSNGINFVEAWVFAEGQGIAYYNAGIVNRIAPTVSGVLKPTEQWNFSQQRGNVNYMGYDAGKIRNFAYQKGKLYCVYNNSEIKVLNAQTGEDYGNLRLGDIVKGGTLTLSDVKCFQGHIIACNLAKKGEELRIYAWDDDKADPYLLYSTTDFQNCTSLGDAMDVAVNCNFDSDLWINFCCDNGSASYVVEINRNSSGVWSKFHRDLTTDGSAYFNVGENARAYPNGGIWWITGNNIQPTLCGWSNGYPSPISIRYAHNLGETWGGAYHEFMLAGNLYAVVPQFDTRTAGDSSSFYRGGKMKFDLVNNDDHSSLSSRGSYPNDGLGSNQNVDCTTDVMINTDSRSFLEAWVFSTNQGIAYYTFGNVPPQNPDPVEILTPHISVSTRELKISAFAGYSDSKEISIVGGKLTDEISISIVDDLDDVFSVSTTSLPTEGGNLTVGYAPDNIGSHSAKLIISSPGAPDVTISLTGTAKAPTKFDDNISELTEIWTINDWAEAAGAYVRSIAFQDGKLYVVLASTGAQEIKILDAYTGAVIGNLDITGVSDGVFKLSGIVAVGGKIFVSNVAASSNVFKIYRWDSDSSSPVVALELAAGTHCADAMGNQLSFTGDLNSGRLLTSDQNTNNLIYFNVSGGNISSTVNKLPLYKADGTTAFTVGNARGSAGVSDAGDGKIYVASKDAYPAIFGADGILIEQMNAGACASNYYGAAISVIPFGTRKYAAVGTYATANSTNNGAFTFADITSGFSTAETFIGKYPAAGFPATNANQQRNQTTVWSTRSDAQILDIWFSSASQGLGYYTYNGIKPADSADAINANSFRIICDGNTLAVTGVEAAVIEIYTPSGILIAQSSSQTIQVSPLRGLYIVKVTDTDGLTHAQKLIIR
ncbi:MAG: family 43 glycosylhydrolase [Muribaculaceae bacterium]